MALRSLPEFGVAMTGPRSRAVLASQWIGKRLAIPVPGCEVRRMWDVLLPDMVEQKPPESKRPRAGAAALPGRLRQDPASAGERVRGRTDQHLRGTDGG